MVLFHGHCPLFMRSFRFDKGLRLMRLASSLCMGFLFLRSHGGYRLYPSALCILRFHHQRYVVTIVLDNTCYRTIVPSCRMGNVLHVDIDEAAALGNQYLMVGFGYRVWV